MTLAPQRPLAIDTTTVRATHNVDAQLHSRLSLLRKPRRERTSIFGLPLDVLTMRETVNEVETLIARGGVHQHVDLNADKCLQAHDDPRLAAAIAKCDIVSADGMSVVWATKLLGAPVPERVAGIDLMDALLARAALRGWSVYFVGARPDVIEKTVEAEMARHPGLVVAGCHHGYWTPEEEADVVAEIARAKPTLLFVGLPSPRKEFFIADHASTMNVNFSMGVGGSFDVVAGVVDRAPTWMQRTGLEWAHRLRMEPRRLLKRYALGNPRFAAMVARASLSTRLASI